MSGDQGDQKKPSVAGRTRALIRKNPTVNRVYRTGVGVAGAGTVALGVVLIPLPGPGALIAVGGLALLGTEFESAKKVSTKANAAAKKAYEKAKTTAAQRRKARQAARPPQ
jgi:uncharacterized protein (TIGR02611 family)